MTEAEMLTELNRKYKRLRYRNVPWHCDDALRTAVLNGWAKGYRKESVSVIPDEVVCNREQRGAYAKRGPDSLLTISISNDRIIAD